jgi:Mg/Co/Ni transporter MgtE
MTVSTITTIDEWAAHPVGKVARVAIAALGLMSATLVLLVATMNSHAAWTLVLLGVALAAASVRAAFSPSLIRLSTLAAVMIAVPYVGQTL